MMTTAATAIVTPERGAVLQQGRSLTSTNGSRYIALEFSDAVMAHLSKRRYQSAISSEVWVPWRRLGPACQNRASIPVGIGTL